MINALLKLQSVWPNDNKYDNLIISHLMHITSNLWRQQFFTLFTDEYRTAPERNRLHRPIWWETCCPQSSWLEPL